MIIYCITNKINGKRYVGQTTQSLQKRWAGHLDSNSSCRYLKHALIKYGKQNFEIKVLARANSMEELNHRETLYIKLFKTLSPHGYNIRVGGSNSPLSKETRLKISESGKGIKKPKTQEHKEKISLSKKGKRQSPIVAKKRLIACYRPIEVPELGIVFESWQQTCKMLGAHKHVIASVLSGRKNNWKGLTFKRSEKNKVKAFSPQSMILLDSFLKNKKNGHIGTKRSPEQIRKIVIKKQRAVFCPQLNKIFDSIKIAAKELNLQVAGVGRTAHGEFSQTGGYTFKFVDEGINNG